MIIGGSASQSLAAEVAKQLDEKLCTVEIKKFPDGEKYFRIKDEIPEDEKVVIIQSTGYPQDENMMELFFILDTLSDMNIEDITVVSPYLGYSRQERRFKEVECISAKATAKLIQSMGVKHLISINLHEESICDLYDIPVDNLSAMPSIAEYIRNNHDDKKPVILAPDKGAENFAKEIAEILDTDYDYLEKVRLSPEVVKTKTKSISVENRSVIIVDDIISTGGTIVNAIDILKKQGAKKVDVVCVHPVLVGDAILKISAAGASSVKATNTLISEVASISVGKTIADHLKTLQ
ncbi:MAG: ribose-phosphate diphosphokinase [Methanosphaera sp.]|uniref:ribose-phosphate diphosphokinase n=1 Tax=Methanosphaera sp. TaxID=2666342 RepID=UPI0025E68AB1|nr:ribose-phosphate diphosphokinase [Methanosphaera sp.]MCI5867337.1 ribose-phosphate diphosphokinase [Methanosphaera sp.]MDD6534595.1 ribose-phosphate diphosphokinase [Methanosphaera sp.]MDY3955737.1 ribose-phosphate diphosphokinase [Methanosphaera sp.]